MSILSEKFREEDYEMQVIDKDGYFIVQLNLDLNDVGPSRQSMIRHIFQDPSALSRVIVASLLEDGYRVLPGNVIDYEIWVARSRYATGNPKYIEGPSGKFVVPR
ncbi:MAG: hypothetical protein ACYCOU_03310 [Sulfobacillus sp.]